MMWDKTKQTIRSGAGSTNFQAGRDINFSINNVPAHLVDKIINEELVKLKKSRFFLEFDITGSSLRLGHRLADGELSGGSNEVRGKALAWCARWLSRSEHINKAEKFLEIANTLGDFTESIFAKAFIISQKGEKDAALKVLAGLNSDTSRSAALIIVIHHDGAENALSWMKQVGYTVKDLDSDGKSVLLGYQLQLGHWNEAALIVKELSEADFEETPVLHHTAALTTLIPIVPLEFRTTVLTHVPFEAHDIPLASDSVALDTIRVAHSHFLNAVEAAKQLSCPQIAKIDDEYALWLELRTPGMADHGKNRLENKLRDPETGLGVVHLALQFGINVDIKAVEQDIDREVAKNSGMTLEAAMARFAIAFTQPTPEAIAKYIARYQEQLAEFIDSNAMSYRQVEMLSRAGFVNEAYKILERLHEEGIPEAHEKKLRRIISEAQGSDPIESRKAQYESTNSLSDLINLVVELEQHQRWSALCEYGRLLFDKTRDLRHAERFVYALNNARKFEALVSFLRENTSILSQSKNLRMLYAWGLYHEGMFLESRAALEDISDEIDSPNYRALQVNLGIASGDWSSLSAYITDECRNIAEKSAQDLIRTSQLALNIGSTQQAKELVFAAAAKADDDPAILVAAYFIAIKAGWENDPQVFKWLEKAASLPGSDGPLQRMSLKDIFDQKPEWDRHESKTWRLLSQGQVPIYLAARSLNRTLIDLTSFPALANLYETDPRRRSVIPAYSGKRFPLEFDISGKSVGLDVTALLTLSFLKILDKALDAFESVYIPHSTLAWLLEERQKATFHQPSQIANALRIRDYLATGILERFNPTSTTSSDLAAQVGEDLAALIAEAEFDRGGDKTQHIVVCSAPVHRLASLIDEEVDLSAHAAVLSSCLSVVEKLKQKGQITTKEEEHARAYLRLHEKPWPNQPDISDGAVLYLNDLVVTYFLHLGLLGKLNAAGLRAVVSHRTVSEKYALISYERISSEVIKIIEDMRASLSFRINSGQIKVGRSRNFDKPEERSVLEHPTIGVFALVANCDLVIVDDRFTNQHLNIDNGCETKPVISTLDLLDALVKHGVLSDDDRLEYRTRLRQAGYFFVSINEEELERCLKESSVTKGAVDETAELKAIRESVLCVRMRDWLKLPEEAPWLDGMQKAFIYTLRNLWADEADFDMVEPKSNWLIDQIDIRGWAHRLALENVENFVHVRYADFILLLIGPLIDVQQSVMDAYWSWVDKKILIPIQEESPKVYESLVSWFREYIIKMDVNNFSESSNV
ncbi:MULTISPECIES: HNH endonuclease [unclassified Prosthecochloris]|uniref:HTH domain-containing protein n=1 Tax=unclassified Prosthecochloris TaxID=2632826 RepID=UPI00223D412C|nr:MULTISPECIES: HNH endonuclease [unclassified Prosthecochloris]UZJ37366.1 HNH endonuclease [Prosthecochloris sp. SCSIO W1103]UZJ39187.1 HNH endonuclease [Prosthecochloris sp. SCSIO W1102]